jgi:AraC family transcriptional regulator, ethanolamine operon transcriptional activator
MSKGAAMAEVLNYETQDVDDQAKALTGWQQDYEQLGCGRFRGSAWQLVMRDGVLLRETTNRQLREQVVPPKNHVVFALPLSVDPGSVFAGRPLQRETLMVLSGQQQHDVISAGELDLVGLSVDRALLESTLPPDKLEWLERMAVERNVELPPQTAAAIRHMLLAVCDAVDAWLPRLADPTQEQALLSSTIGHAVILAMAAEGQSGPSTIPRRAETRLKVVRRAVDFMHANIEEDIGVPQICAAACASRRTLQYCFEEFMHTTPQAYLRALRLNEARRVLKVRAQQPISELATTLGFSNASHFTRHYKLMFDELPSETLKLHCYGPRVG